MFHSVPYPSFLGQMLDHMGQRNLSLYGSFLYESIADQEWLRYLVSSMQGSRNALHGVKEGRQASTLQYPLHDSHHSDNGACKMRVRGASLSCKLGCRVIHSRIEDALSYGLCQIPVQE